ncbi:MAG: gamma carbonic anhydrase family protein [Candidatus Hodarchaeales archaeon]|jgi:carbonic anhydrase/acetyltransferase-like protein (isoleucine patch superfamily)
MPLYKLGEDRIPVVGKDTHCFETAIIIGKVTIGEKCYIGPGAAIKGDYGEIVIGSRNSIQENVIIHARPGEKTEIGNDVTVGHGAILHNCEVKDGAVIGMGAIISDYAIVGENAIVGEGAVVRQNQEIPSESVAVGVPAKIVSKTVKSSTREELTRFKGTYIKLAQKYNEMLEKLD